MTSSRRKKRDVHVPNEDGMVACNPRDREAAHRASVGDIATAGSEGVTCQKCLGWVLSKMRQSKNDK